VVRVPRPIPLHVLVCTGPLACAPNRALSSRLASMHGSLRIATHACSWSRYAELDGGQMTPLISLECGEDVQAAETMSCSQLQHSVRAHLANDKVEKPVAIELVGIFGAGRCSLRWLSGQSSGRGRLSVATVSG
jgi:hypothetical protein